MVNAEKLWEVYEVIKANPHRWNQERWAVADNANPNATSYKDCGTSFCVAGWGARINGWRPMLYRELDGKLRPLEHIFVPESSPANSVFYTGQLDGECRSPREIAQELFELNDHEASVLFAASAASNLEELKYLIRRVVSGAVCSRTGFPCEGYGCQCPLDDDDEDECYDLLSED